MLNLLADIAKGIGNACVDHAEKLQKRRDRWVARGRFWSDVTKWLRLRCVKDFAEIRAERKAAAQ